MKKLLRFLAVLTLCALCVPYALGIGPDSDANAHAETLYALHLLRGTGVNDDGSPIYSLDQRPSRLQGLIMMIRFLGEEEAALAGTPESPFTDVYGDGRAYVAYAYRRGVTNGTTNTTFTPYSPLSAKAYLAFLLRAMGYSESDGDYTWDGLMSFAASLGLLSDTEAAYLDANPLTRGDMVDLSYRALTLPVKGDARALARILCEKGVFTAEEGVNAGILSPEASAPDTDETDNSASATAEPVPAPADESTISYEKKSVRTSAGSVTAHVLTVNTHNPNVRVRTALVDGKLGHTASFTKIVQNSGAVAVINGNFFSSYSKFPAPIGHVMSYGEFLYGNSGLTSFGFTSDGTIQIGRPAVFTGLTSGENEWSVYEINTPEQSDSVSVLYTPAYGEQIVTSNSGWALRVDKGVITDFYSISAGAAVTIPAEGYVVYMGGGYASTPYFHIPQKGASISMEYYLRVADEEGFTLDDVQHIVSGAPRLVQNGQIVTELEEGFTESRFTTAASSRTAIGVNGEGKLLLISVPSNVTIQQMRELSVALGCVDAVNLDGGASSAMYYRGNYLTVPGRELAVTLQVFVNE